MLTYKIHTCIISVLLLAILRSYKTVQETIQSIHSTQYANIAFTHSQPHQSGKILKIRYKHNLEYQNRSCDFQRFEAHRLLTILKKMLCSVDLGLPWKRDLARSKNYLIQRFKTCLHLKSLTSKWADHVEAEFVFFWETTSVIIEEWTLPPYLSFFSFLGALVY